VQFVQFVLRCQSRPGVAAYLLRALLALRAHYGTLQNDEGLNVIGEGAEPAFSTLRTESLPITPGGGDER
jgi:hypothetical protein